MKHVFLALTNPVPGREADFNAWYDKSHLREVVQYGSGMLGGRRFRIAESQRPESETAPWQYLAWYDMDHADLATYHREPWIPNRPALAPFKGLVADGHVAWIYTPIGNTIGDAAILQGRPGKGRYLFFAFTNAGAGHEPAFNDWYDKHHAPEVVAKLPGFVAGQRYRAAPEQRTTQPPLPWRYLAIYEVEAARAGAANAAAEGAKALTQAPAGALDPKHVAWTFESIGEYYKRV
jgi:hypothetical protein